MFKYKIRDIQGLEEEISKIGTGGTGGGMVDSTVTTRISALEETVDPLVVTLSSNVSVVETGSIVSSVVFTWSYNKTIGSQTFEGTTLATDLRTKTYTTPFTANKTFTLNATSEAGTLKAKTTSVYFCNGVYSGKSSSVTYNSALITSLTKTLSDTKARTISVTAGTGEYIYYALPTRLGTPTFTVGGFAGGFSKVASALSFTNPSAFVELYDIWRSDNSNLGLTSVVIG